MEEINNTQEAQNAIPQDVREDGKPFSLNNADNQPETTAAKTEQAPKAKKCCLNYSPVAIVVDLVLVLAIVLLFVMNHQGKSTQGEVAGVDNVAAATGTGDVYYVNIDSINECSYVKTRNDAFQAEADKQTASLTARQSKLEADYNQFQKNYQSGTLTEQQAQFAMQKLQDQKDKIDADYQKIMGDLSAKQAEQQQQLMNTIRETVAAVNTQSKNAPKASFVITYSADFPTVLLVDPSRDLTKAVVTELEKKN